MSRQRVDLNLFRVFESVLEHRSVSGAARVLGVTPSAVSHALGRLRQALGDDLFVPGESGMEPTKRALDLAPRVRDGLALIDGAISVRPFEPAESVRTFRIAATEYSATTMVAPLAGRLARVAPGIELRVFPYSRLDVARNLDDGRIDLVLGWFGEVPERMCRKVIAADQEAVVVRPGHPLSEGTVTLERIFDYPFLVVELTGSEEPAVEGFLDDRGVWRRVWIDRLLIETGPGDQDLVGHVALSVPYYAAVPPALAVSDMVATLPLSLAREAEAQGRVVILDLPYEPLAVELEVLWHQRGDRDPGLRWLIDQIAEVMEAGETSPLR